MIKHKMQNKERKIMHRLLREDLVMRNSLNTRMASPMVQWGNKMDPGPRGDK